MRRYTYLNVLEFFHTLLVPLEQHLKQSKNIDVYLAFTRILKITPFWILTHTLASAVHPKIAVFSYKSIKMFAIGEISSR